MFPKIFERFIEESPVTVMFRGVLENIFSAKRLDRIFAKQAKQQVTRELLFSTCCDLMSLVVAGKQKSINTAYLSKEDELSVAIKSVYNKLAGIEPTVSEHMVSETADDLAKVIREMKGEVEGPLLGHDVRILDGNSLRGTNHLIKELRPLGAAALPGKSLAVLNPQLGLVEEVITCENGHTSERKLIPDALERIHAGQCWMADSAFSTYEFIFGVHNTSASFIVRQHGNLKGTLLGKRREIGKCDTGRIFEQNMELSYRRQAIVIRRITIKRYKPTEKGHKEVHILTNLPRSVRAGKIAQAYRGRWKIETAFQDLATCFQSEINTLGYPRAALFGFCMGVVLSNAMSTIKAALRTSSESKDSDRKLSTYYLINEIATTWRGMQISINSIHWEREFAILTPTQLAKKLKWLARQVKLKRFYTNKWKPRKPKTKKVSGNRGNHVATQKLLDSRKKTTSS